MGTKTYSKRKIRKILKDNGWKFHHQTGSHCVYKNEKGEHLTVTVGNCNKMVFQRLIKEHNLKVD
jgi:predicted RNA binding protein YcfA (HicA-like mRNA interferase family)